ncbi:hypothetical protein [Acinetobacter sp. HZNU-JH01]|uniref:hypothetical protein n=1 Tax=Acinetobacter sp. HZNU-JH01 TaxID=3136280 RepID=UPI0030F44764
MDLQNFNDVQCKISSMIFWGGFFKGALSVIIFWGMMYIYKYFKNKDISVKIDVKNQKE